MITVFKKIADWLTNADLGEIKFKIIHMDQDFLKEFHDVNNFWHEMANGFYEEQEAGQALSKYNKYRDLDMNGYLDFSNPDKNGEFVVRYEKNNIDKKPEKIINFFKKAGVEIMEVKKR